MKPLLLDDAQWGDVTKDFELPFREHEVTPELWDLMRSHPAFKQIKTTFGNAVRLALAYATSDSPNVIVTSLPQYHTKADTSLVYSWDRRLDEDERLKAIDLRFRKAGKVKDLEIVDSTVPGIPSWQTCHVVSEIDLLLWAGLDPEELLKEQPNQAVIERYCKLVRDLTDFTGIITLGDFYKGCVGKDGAKPDPCIREWMTLPTTQVEGGPLIVRKMKVNPAVRFEHEGTVYTFAPIHAPEAFAKIPEGNKVKRILPGGPAVLSALVAGEPDLVTQIKAGTCPRIDVPGMQLRSDGAFSDRPCLGGGGGSAWLNGAHASSASESFGSLGCAGE